MASRVVLPEILDQLPSTHEDAIRSRRDLRRINKIMENDQWILGTAVDFHSAAQDGIVDIGAGDGTLLNALAQEFPDTLLTGYDLAPRPTTLNTRISWNTGDIFNASTNDGPQIRGGILTANLFLHHFEGEALEALGRVCSNFRVIIFNEPARRIVPHILGTALSPFINYVTRHDMHVSIRAGFRPGELPRLMNLNSMHWEIREHFAWRGAQRLVGVRK